MVLWTGTGRAASGVILGTITFALSVSLLLPGCESEQERKDLKREQRLLQDRQAGLEHELQSVTGGRTELTEDEKAHAALIWLELRKVQTSLTTIQNRLRELN